MKTLGKGEKKRTPTRKVVNVNGGEGLGNYFGQRKETRFLHTQREREGKMSTPLHESERAVEQRKMRTMWKGPAISPRFPW